MKMGYVALAIIVLISSLLFMFNMHLEKSITEMTKTTEKIDTFIYEGKYEKALPQFKKLKKLWEKSDKIFELQIENEELDNINGLIAEIEAYFERGFFEDYFEASYKLKFSLNHLLEKNTLSFETVL